MGPAHGRQVEGVCLPSALLRGVRKGGCSSVLALGDPTLDLKRWQEEACRAAHLCDYGGDLPREGERRRGFLRGRGP